MKSFWSRKPHPSIKGIQKRIRGFHSKWKTGYVVKVEYNNWYCSRCKTGRFIHRVKIHYKNRSFYFFKCANCGETFTETIEKEQLE